MVSWSRRYAIKDCPSVKELIETTKNEFIESIENQTKLLEKYS
jgi:hypothetical protein